MVLDEDKATCIEHDYPTSVRKKTQVEECRIRGVPKQRTLTMMPWLSIMESTYRPVPEQVAQSNAPLASQQVQR